MNSIKCGSKELTLFNIKVCFFVKYIQIQFFVVISTEISVQLM